MFPAKNISASKFSFPSLAMPAYWMLFFSLMLLNASFAEYISINTDIYELLIENNGIVHVNYINNVPLFEGIYAQIRVENEDKYRQLRFDADKSQRFQVRNRLGRGQAIILYGRDCEWQFHTYPGQQFFTVTLLYKNTGNAAVEVAALSPFTVSSAFERDFTRNRAAETTTVAVFNDGSKVIRKLSGIGETVVQVANKSRARVLTGGFLTQKMADTFFEVVVSTPEEDHDFACFKAICTYNPPIRLLPGESIETEQLYIASSALSDFKSLDRYGAAVAAVNNLKPLDKTLPCGLDIDLRCCATEQVLDALAWQKKQLYNWGWTNVTLNGDWNADIGSESIRGMSFRDNGIASIMDAAQRATLTVGIRLRPFIVGPDNDLQQRKPDWFLPRVDNNESYVINVARDDVRQWLGDLASSLTKDYGFQTLILEDADCLLQADLSSNFNFTQIQFYRYGVSAIRSGMSAGCNLVVSPYQPAALPYVDSMGPGGISNDRWSETYRLDSALLPQAHLYATGVLPYAGRVAIENTTKDTQARKQLEATLTAIALSGASIQVNNLPDTMAQETLALLKRLSPPLPHPAFEIRPQPNATTAIRYLPLKTKVGEWHLLAFFNWSRLQSSTLSVNLNTLGMNEETPYTLYELFPEKYHGLLKTKSALAVAPSSVRLFCLRPYQQRPMLLSSDRHLSQGALDHTDIA